MRRVANAVLPLMHCMCNALSKAEVKWTDCNSFHSLSRNKNICILLNSNPDFRKCYQTGLRAQPFLDFSL